MAFVNLSLLEYRTACPELSVFTGDLFLGADSLSGFVKEYASGGDLHFRVRKQSALTEDQVNVVVGFAFVVVQSGNALNAIPTVKGFGKIFQNCIGIKLGVNLRQSDNQFPCFNALSLGSASLEFLLTTPEWLTGLSDDKEYDSKTLCQMDIDKHIQKYLETLSSTVKTEPHQQLLTTFLGKMIDLYSVLCFYWADAIAELDRVAEDEGLKQSLRRYAIESGAIKERVYQSEMEMPIEDMKRFLDGILHIYDEGRTNVSMSDLFGIVAEAEAKLSEKNGSVAP